MSRGLGLKVSDKVQAAGDTQLGRGARSRAERYRGGVQGRERVRPDSS